LAHIGLGACLENLILSARNSGYDAKVNYFPSEANPLLAAEISFYPTKDESSPKFQRELYDSINIRCTNRKKGTQQAIDKGALEKIQSSVGTDFEVVFTEDENQINELADIVSFVEKLRFLNPNGHYEFFKKELRWNEEEAKQTKDGLDIATLELSYLDQTGLKVASSPDVISYTRKWQGGGGLQKITRDAIKSSSAIGLIRSSSKQVKNYIQAGQAIERAWLMANHYNISVHPISSPLFFFDRLDNKNDLPIDMQEVLKTQELRFTKIFNKDGAVNYFLFRLSTADKASVISLRKDIGSCLIIGGS
jgi:hypothetical protein